jgi:hypothetical protein
LKRDFGVENWKKIFVEVWERLRPIIELGAQKILGGKKRFFAVKRNFWSVGDRVRGWALLLLGIGVRGVGPKGWVV